MRNPAFALATTLTLAVGLGANCGVFSIVDSVFLRRVSVRDPDHLVKLYSSDLDDRTHPSSVFAHWSEPECKDLSRRLSSVDLVCYGAGSARLGLTNDAPTVHLLLTSANYFTVIGQGLLFGRGFDSTNVPSVVLYRPTAS